MGIHTMGAASTVRVVMINIIATACVLELPLHVQQRIGPLIDLKPVRAESIMSGLSEELSHVPAAGDGWDRDGFRTMDEPNSARCSRKLLFMGDSFMQGIRKMPEGYGGPSFPSDTVPVHVRRFFREWSGEDVCVFNAGFASYAPSIFVPQAKKLIPLVRPDMVVIDVDETDIFDDYYRYRELVTRDADGSIVAVGPTPINVQFRQGLVESTSKTPFRA